MAINFNSQINTLYAGSVASDAAYQSPGTYGIPEIDIEGGIDSVAVTNAGTGYTTVVPTVSASVGTGATFVTTMKVLTAALLAAGTGYVPADTITLAVTGGTVATRPILTVTTTKVVSASVGAGGTGGTPGTQTVTGTTGTGTPFQASVTVSGGGAITAVLSITVAGSYTVNPTLTNQPVTGASLTGAQLTVVMGVNTFTVTTAGSATVITAAATQFATSGSGTGFTADTLTWGVNTITVSASGTGYNPASSVISFSGGTGASAAATATYSNAEETRLLTLVEVVGAFMGSAGSAAEVYAARDVLRQMVNKTYSVGATFNASTIKTSVVKAGVQKYATQARSDY